MSALFYLKYYGLKLTDASATKAIKDNEDNLNHLYAQTQTSTNSKNRYQIAKNLRKEGEFAAAIYEFIQADSDASIKEDSNIQCGDLYAILGNFQQAADHYKKALNSNNKNAQTHLKLAKAYDELGESNLANTEYNYTLSQVDENMPLLLELESIWIRKIGIEPNNAEAHTNLGAVYQKLGDNQKALQEYSKAKALNPKNLTTRFNLGTLYQGQKEYELAIKAYDDVIQMEPNNTTARYYKASCLSELKQFEKAAEEYKKILTTEPNNLEVKKLMLEALNQTATPEEMLDNYAEAIKIGQSDGDTLYNYAYELHKANLLDDAIINYTKALNLNPKNTDAYINLAQAYKQKNDLSNESKTISEGLLNNPNNTNLKKYESELKADITATQANSALKMYQDGKYAEAIERYLTIEPKTSEIYTNIGSCYQALNNNEKAIEYYKLAFSKTPNNADIAVYLGQSYINTEDWANAQNYLAKALTLKPNDSDIKELYKYVTDKQDETALARVLEMYNKQDYTNALAILNNILVHNKNNAHAYYYKGMIFDVQKKYEQAIIEYQKATQISNEIPVAYYSIALDLEYLKQYNEALSNYQKYLSLEPEQNEYTQYAQSRIQALNEYANSKN